MVGHSTFSPQLQGVSGNRHLVTVGEQTLLGPVTKLITGRDASYESTEQEQNSGNSHIKLLIRGRQSQMSQPATAAATTQQQQQQKHQQHLKTNLTSNDDHCSGNGIALRISVFQG